MSPSFCVDRSRITAVQSTPEEIAKWRGASKREIIRHFVKQQFPSGNPDRDKLINTVYDEFTVGLIAAYRSVPPIAGAEDAIRELRQKGYLVATTTGSIVPSPRPFLTVWIGTSYFVANGVQRRCCTRAAVAVHAIPRDGNRAG